MHIAALPLRGVLAKQVKRSEFSDGEGCDDRRGENEGVEGNSG